MSFSADTFIKIWQIDESILQAENIDADFESNFCKLKQSFNYKYDEQKITNDVPTAASWIHQMLN